jgi:hydrogenase nickel incorporation protein HypB
MNTVTLKDRVDQNETAARANRQAFDAAGVTVFTLIGPAGSGKTSLIETLLLRLAPPARCAFILANQAADRQISRITRHGYPAVAIKTDSISAVQVQDAVKRLDLSQLDLLFIEADGNGLNSQSSNVGHHFRIGVFSAAGGDDKVNEFPSLVAGADLLLLTKIDLLPFVKFDLKVFADDIARIKRTLPTLQLSAQSGVGLDKVLDWVRTHGEARRAPRKENGDRALIQSCSTKRREESRGDP